MNPSKTSLLVLILFLLSCKTVAAQNHYKGGKKHEAPVLDFSPKNGDYDTNMRVSGALKDSLDKKVNDLFKITGMPGISAAMLIPGKGFWQTDTGFISRPSQQKADSTTLFYWASVGKLITATIIIELIGEQKLHYDSKLSAWFPQFENADGITIENLLNHTSGIYSFNNDSSAFSVNRYYTPQELIQLSLARKNLFKPGQYWSYSNTGYLLLALIAEKIEQKTYAQIVQQRISGPLHLTTLRALAPQELPANLALAHTKNGIATESYATPLGAGNVVSNARDMVVLLYALFTGQLGTPPIQERLTDLYPMFDKGTYYGNGIMLSDFSEINNTKDLWIGHSGGTETYRAILAYDVAKKVFLAVAINQHISVEATALQLLSQIK